MARIPEAEIERLKSEIALVRLAESAGVQLQRHGADLLGLCPFHDDHEPSLVISPKKNLWHCLGACQTGGSVIDWVMRINGVSFRHAVEILREGVLPLAADKAIVKQSTVPKLPAPVAVDADNRALLKQVIDYYHETLKQSPEALAYLKQRGLDHPELIDTFKLGFANRTLGLRLPDKNRLAGNELRTRLQRLGLYRESGHEHFNGSLVIPIFDEQGNVTEVYGRKITDKLRPGTPLHLYLPGPHAGVWNIAALAANKEIILCEALIDAMTFWCAGYRNVTASYGVEGFTDDHLAAFKQHGTERVLIAYDRDEAGDNAAARLSEKLTTEGIECYRIQFPKGMDANEYAIKLQPASKSLGLVIRKALWLGKGVPPACGPQAAVVTDRDHLVNVSAEVVANGDPRTPSTPAATEKTPETAPAALPTLPASPMPSAPASDIEAEIKDNEITLAFGERRYRVRGLAKNLAYDVMKVNVLVAWVERFHVDTLDLYAAKARASYIAQAAIELNLKEDVLKGDLGRVLLKLEALQDERIRQTLAPQPVEGVAIDAAEREAALALLKAPDLFDRVLVDFQTCGIVGERINKLVGYLAATSRRLAAPLAVIVRSSSAAGKSSLMDAVLAMMPEEERVKYSAMTGQSLFYMGETNLKHKILAIAEEEGAARASYALKLLQSEGELTIASTGKDPATGNLITQAYRVEGPVAIFLTTTAIEIDPELLNRCLVLSVDEGRAQTQAIHRLQREKRTLEGLLAREDKDYLLRLHQNAQRLLKPLAVLNPYARQLTFPDSTTRLRRDHEKYLTLIDTIALLHQYQRDVKTTTRRGKTIEYIEVTLDDIAMANQLAHEVLGRSLDELPPQTRTVLRRLADMVADLAGALDMRKADYHFSRRQAREYLNLGDTQLKVHLARLVEMEYLIVHRAVKGGSFVYELLYEPQHAEDGTPFMPGLIDADALKHPYDAKRSGLDEMQSAPDRGTVGGQSASGRDDGSPGHPMPIGHIAPVRVKSANTHFLRRNNPDSSYPQHLPPVAAAVER